MPGCGGTAYWRQREHETQANLAYRQHSSACGCSDTGIHVLLRNVGWPDGPSRAYLCSRINTGPSQAHPHVDQADIDSNTKTGCYVSASKCGTDSDRRGRQSAPRPTAVRIHDGELLRLGELLGVPRRALGRGGQRCFNRFSLAIDYDGERR